MAKKKGNNMAGKKSGSIIDEPIVSANKENKSGKAKKSKKQSRGK